jgi:hypothetical protein
MIRDKRLTESLQPPVSPIDIDVALAVAPTAVAVPVISMAVLIVADGALEFVITISILSTHGFVQGRPRF